MMLAAAGQSSFSLSVSVCVCLSLSVSVSVCLCLSLSLSLSVSLSLSLSVSLPLSVSVCPSVSLSQHVSAACATRFFQLCRACLTWLVSRVTRLGLTTKIMQKTCIIKVLDPNQRRNGESAYNSARQLF